MFDELHPTASAVHGKLIQSQALEAQQSLPHFLIFDLLALVSAFPFQPGQEETTQTLLCCSAHIHSGNRGAQVVTNETEIKLDGLIDTGRPVKSLEEDEALSSAEHTPTLSSIYTIVPLFSCFSHSSCRRLVRDSEILNVEFRKDVRND